MTRIQDLNKFGQSIWLDFIRRSFIKEGELDKLIDQGVRGVTSNPSIFEKAIAGSVDYDEDIRSLVRAGKSTTEIYEALVLNDIRMAADILLPVYKRTNARDGYVSLEVSPNLADDTNGTIAEAKRLYAALNRPNIMIKVPATPEGIPAIETLIGLGINVNVTLMFSLHHYDEVAGAYLNGLEHLAIEGGDLNKVASVASFFVSRVETAVDKALDEKGISSLKGKIAIANTKAAYARFRETFSGQRWDRLAKQGARVQRPLWASTGTKNPAYPDTYYIDNLIGPATVNTVPPASLDAFQDHGQVSASIEEGQDLAQIQLKQLEQAGIDLDSITEKLQKEGVASFAKSFKQLMESIDRKREKLMANWQLLTSRLGEYHFAVDSALQEVRNAKVMSRIWAHDYTVWKPGPKEIVNRLGWLHIADQMRGNVPELNELADQLYKEGYRHVLLLGMGGSSLAPEVFRKCFGVRKGRLDLSVLDSTEPAVVRRYGEGLDLLRTVFIVATKSGGTVETISFFKYFYNLVLNMAGEERAGAGFIAITDPGSKLVDLAETYRFRKTYINDPNIGGRYSALSYFGLVPAALLGVDLETLLDRALRTVCNCDGCNCPVNGNNYGARLGVILSELALAGRDKLTLVAPEEVASFGDWVEQLIAESTGKEGKGILPVVSEPLGSSDVYGADRLFVQLRVDDRHDNLMAQLAGEGHPVVTLNLEDRYDLGGQIFLWEMATAVAGHRLAINPFDQPDVESAKVLARAMVAEFQSTGELPKGNTLEPSAQHLRAFLSHAETGSYISIQAYLEPVKETDDLLKTLQRKLRARTQLATTIGYGPRFLHSTGQLHKGDAGNGFFIQLLGSTGPDVPIPDKAGEVTSSMSFGTLIKAQALGDAQALQAAGRRVIQFDLDDQILAGLRILKG